MAIDKKHLPINAGKLQQTCGKGVDEVCTSVLLRQRRQTFPKCFLVRRAAPAQKQSKFARINELQGLYRLDLPKHTVEECPKEVRSLIGRADKFGVWPQKCLKLKLLEKKMVHEAAGKIITNSVGEPLDKRLLSRSFRDGAGFLGHFADRLAKLRVSIKIELELPVLPALLVDGVGRLGKLHDLFEGQRFLGSRAAILGADSQHRAS